MADTPLVAVDPKDPYAAQYEIAKRKLLKEKQEALKSTAETYGSRGRFFSGNLIKAEGKVEEGYATSLGDVAQNIAIQRAAEEQAVKRTKEAQEYQTSERVAGQGFQTSQVAEQRAWQSAEAAAGRTFTTQERTSAQDFSKLESADQRSWASAEAKLGRTFTTQEREAVQAFQQGQYDVQNDLASKQQAWLMSDEYWNKQYAVAGAGKGSPVSVGVSAGGVGDVLGKTAGGIAKGAEVGSAIIPGVGTVVGGVIGGLQELWNGLFGSDRRIKKDIVPTKYSLADLLQVEVVDFEYTDETFGSLNTTHTGVIAQNLEEHYPYAVKSIGNFYGVNDVKVVNYQLIVPLLIKSIQELNTRIKELEGK